MGKLQYYSEGFSDLLLIKILISTHLQYSVQQQQYPITRHNTECGQFYITTMSTHLGVELLVLAEKVNAKLRQPDEVLQPPPRREWNLTASD